MKTSSTAQAMIEETTGQPGRPDAPNTRAATRAEGRRLVAQK